MLAPSSLAPVHRPHLTTSPHKPFRSFQDDRKRRRKKRAKLYRQRERLDHDEMERQETARLEAQALKKKEEFERFMARQVCAKPLVLLRRAPVRACL